MEKSIEKTVVSIKTTHQFYCDDCGKFLGESDECDDGWYPTPKAVIGRRISWRVNGVGYKIEKCICEECDNTFMRKIDKALTELGFDKI